VTSEISRLPPYLAVQFVRFYFRKDTKKKAKICRTVYFPTVHTNTHTTRRKSAALSTSPRFQDAEVLEMLTHTHYTDVDTYHTHYTDVDTYHTL
jgi:hypothetical protein